MFSRPPKVSREREESIARSAVFCVAVLLVAAAGIADAQPEVARIVSTSPSITETLFALGLGDRVVGVSTYCRYPPRPLALPKVGNFLRPNTELIARLRPDLVIVHADRTTCRGSLSELGIPTITFVDRGTLASVYSSIRTIGRATRVAERAERSSPNCRDGSTRVRAAAVKRPPRKVLVIVGRSPGALTDLVAVGRGSYLNDLVTGRRRRERAGRSGAAEYPRISMETVIRLGPDVIVDAGDMGDTDEEHGAGSRRRSACGGSSGGARRRRPAPCTRSRATRSSFLVRAWSRRRRRWRDGCATRAAR